MTTFLIHGIDPVLWERYTYTIPKRKKINDDLIDLIAAAVKEHEKAHPGPEVEAAVPEKLGVAM